MECIKNRRTIRKYKADEVSVELLNALLEEAFRASTMGNMQLFFSFYLPYDFSKQK